MGFTAQLVLFYPTQFEIYPPLSSEEELPDPSFCRTVWQSRETIDFGHITRLEKLTSPKYKHLEFTSHRQAGICVVSNWLQHVWPEGKEKFAPQFLVGDMHHERMETLESLPSDKTYASWDTEILGNKEDQTREDIAGHNSALQLDEQTFRKFVEEKYDPRIQPPFLWESCINLARSLDEAEGSDSEEWQALIKDQTSLALTRAWREYLRELGAVDVHGLLYCPFI